MSKTPKTIQDSSKVATSIIQESEEATPPVLRKLAIVEGKLVEASVNRYFTGFSEVVGLPGIEIVKTPPAFGVTSFMPRLTFDEWKQIVAFHRWSVATYNAETHLSTLLTDQGNYIHCPFHQSIRRGAMTVNVDYTTPENIAILEQFQNEHGVNTGDFHASTHNHVKAPAFASGTDKDDETFKQGWHFTIGNCDMPKITIDGRVRIKFNPRFDEEGRKLVSASSTLHSIVDWSNWVDIPQVPADMPDSIRKEAALYWLTQCPDEGFPESWKDYITEVKSPVFTGYQGRRYPQLTQGGGMSQQQSWRDEDWVPGSRKTTGTPASAEGGVPKRITTVPANKAHQRGHILAYGAVSEEKVVENNASNTSISREQYREFRVEMSILDMLAAHLLTISDGLEIVRGVQQDPTGLYTKVGTTIARAAKDIMDSEDLPVLAKACKNLEELFKTCPGYMVSQAPGESPSNRRYLLSSILRQTADV